MAKLSEQEAEAQAVLDEATALMADADRRAIALAQVSLHANMLGITGKVLASPFFDNSQARKAGVPWMLVICTKFY